MRALLSLGAIALALSSCAWKGPGAIVYPTGPTSDGTGTVGAFRAAYDRSAASANPADAYEMVRVGAELQYQLCSDFFRGAGKEQQWLLFSKDFLAFAAAATTGVIGATGGSATAIAWIGLSAASAITGINVYERNFLFSENNVQHVQDLTLRAVSSARTLALGADRKDSYTFASGVSALMDIQGICEVQNILVLVRQSMDAAKTDAAPTGLDTALAGFVTADLGILLNNGTPLSNDQLQGLYWLFIYPDRPTADQKRNFLYSRLQSLNPRPLNSDGSSNPAFDSRLTQVTSTLGRLPASVQTQIAGNIKKFIADNATNNKAGFVDPSVQVPFGSLSSTGSGSLGRIQVKIRGSN